MNPRRCRKRRNRLNETGANHVPSPQSSDPNARDRERPIKPPDLEGTAAAIDGLIGTLERHLPGCGRSDVLDAATAKGGFAGPDRVAIGLARAETRLRVLADRIERMRAARRK